MGVGKSRCFQYLLLAWLVCAVGYVLEKGAVEKNRILRNDCNGTPEFFLRDFGDIVASDRDLTAL